MLNYTDLQNWNTYAEKIALLLQNIVVTDAQSKIIDIELAFNNLFQIVEQLRAIKGEISFVGNGASASIASHCSADIFKNGRIKTRLFTDLALISAVGNDVSFDQIYALPIEICMNKGDLLIAISSSGASPNILQATNAAHHCAGNVVTFSAFAETNLLRQQGDLNFYVPTQSYGFAESCHATLLHYWIDNIIVNYQKSLAKEV